jgi:hypothetical protein
METKLDGKGLEAAAKAYNSVYNEPVCGRDLEATAKAIQAYLDAIKPAQANCRSEFEVWAKDYYYGLDDCTFLELIEQCESDWSVWQAAYNKGSDKLREAVVILPDDAEPQDGDIVRVCSYYANGNQLSEHIWKVDEPKDWQHWRKRGDSIEIIQCQGKPVVYQSVLSEGVCTKN